jgi:hypothetical protein
LIGGGTKTRAAQEDIWLAQRSSAFANLGTCQAAAKNFGEALSNYEQSVAVFDRDPLVFRMMASAQLELFKQNKDEALVVEAGRSLCKALNITRDDASAQEMRGYLAKISERVKRDPKSLGCKN